MSDFEARLQSFVGRPAGPPRISRDPVERSMIRHFVEAVDDHNPIYVDDEAARATGRAGVVAPPAMLSTWVMRGYRAHHRTPAPTEVSASPLDELLELLGERGFTGVVATDSEQVYQRELVPGDRIRSELVISAVSAEKQTGLGAGHFITTTRTYRDAEDAVVATETFRILRFDPTRARGKATDRPAAADPADRPRPFLLRDNEFWFAAARERRLLIQRCADCATLRHPPGPMCPQCHSFDWDTVTAAGTGTVHSFVISHHPRAAGFDYPLPIVLVDLTEGTRLVADYRGPIEELEIGLPVRVGWTELDSETTLPHFEKAEA
ncbi:hypothetical protein CGZ93_17475 [Enemella dayhoffiae]|uniref:DNA-binding protein n=1 Tax=Enemella dayhoffiae TaxID=2016507 RepID=A0A255GPR1_9ACTN|nr:MaoC family dehydratase N-terminal domain-containing protein [Enemella dayhoffiae]OYO16556.1 hypothetical protein CGZ93_17475 [Enemella dayhoffiae]